MKNKYLTLLFIVVKNYEINNLIDYLQKKVNRSISFLTILIFWLNIKNTINGENVVIYLLAAYLMSNCTLIHNSHYSSRIRNGRIIIYSLKPFNFIKIRLFREILNQIANLSVTIIEIKIISILLKLDITFINIFTYKFIFFTISAILIGYLIYLSTSLLFFYFKNAEFVNYVYFMVINILGGLYFPLSIFPNKLFEFINYTPFPYLIYVPSKIMTDNGYVVHQHMYALPIIWIFILYFFNKKMWKLSINYYNNNGKAY